MANLLKNVLAVLVGIVLGSVVNMAIVTVGPQVIPLPDGVDLSNMETFAENLKRLSPVNFIAPWLAHALGTLAGAFITSKLAASNKLALAIFIGAFFLLGGITMVLMVGGPLWFILLDLLGAYLPMAYLGGMLGQSKQTHRPQRSTPISS